MWNSNSLCIWTKKINKSDKVGLISKTFWLWLNLFVYISFMKVHWQSCKTLDAYINVPAYYMMPWFAAFKGKFSWSTLKSQASVWEKKKRSQDNKSIVVSNIEYDKKKN